MILISAGHNKRGPGACNKNWCEYDETPHWAQSIYDHIYALHSADVMLVPTGSLSSKIHFVNSFPMPRKNLACEIHFNSNVAAHGSETLFCPGSSRGKKVATIVQKALATQFPPDRGVKHGWYRMDRPGIVDYPGDVDGDESHDAFLSQTDCVAIIVEPEFVSNRITIQEGRMNGTLLIARALVRADPERFSESA